MRTFRLLPPSSSCPRARLSVTLIPCRGLCPIFQVPEAPAIPAPFSTSWPRHFSSDTRKPKVVQRSSVPSIPEAPPSKENVDEKSSRSPAISPFYEPLKKSLGKLLSAKNLDKAYEIILAFAAENRKVLVDGIASHDALSFRAYLVVLEHLCQANVPFGCRQLVEEMRKSGNSPSVAGYMTMIKKCGSCQNAAAAVEIFEEMRKDGLERSDAAYSNLVHACINGNNVDLAFKYLEERLQRDFALSEYTYSATLRIILARGGANGSEALSILEEMKSKEVAIEGPTIYFMLSIAVQAKSLDIALRILDEAEAMGIDVERRCFIQAFSLAISARDVPAASKVTDQLQRHGLDLTLKEWVSFLSLYARSRSVEDTAEQLRKVPQVSVTLVAARTMVRLVADERLIEADQFFAALDLAKLAWNPAMVEIAYNLCSRTHSSKVFSTLQKLIVKNFPRLDSLTRFYLMRLHFISNEVLDAERIFLYLKSMALVELPWLKKTGIWQIMEGLATLKGKARENYLKMEMARERSIAGKVLERQMLSQTYSRV